MILVFYETHDLSKWELDSPLLHRTATPYLIQLLKNYISVWLKNRSRICFIYRIRFFEISLIAIHDHHIISLWIFWYYWHLWSGSYVTNPSDCNCHYYDGLLHYIIQYQSLLWMWRSITSSLEWHHFDGYTWKCTKTAATSNE